MAASIDARCAWRIVRKARTHDPCSAWQPDETMTIQPGGIWSAAGEVSEQAAVLFDTLLPIAFSASDYVVAQVGQSLDGRIATANGDSHYVTGEASRTHLHRLRALVDAVIVGAETVLIDDPRLTVRHVEGDSPVRVVLDPHARVPTDRGVFVDAGPPTWHVVSQLDEAAPGSVPLQLPDVPVDEVPRQLLDALARQGLRRVLVEGGGQTISRFVEAGCVDRLHAVVAPILIGSGRPALSLAEIGGLGQALRPHCRTCALGEDVLYDLNLRATARESISRMVRRQ